MSGKKSKILLLSQGTDFYGSNFILLEAAKHLKNEGFQLHVILPGNGPITKEFEKLHITTKVINLGILRRRYVTFFGLINRAYYFFSALFVLLYLVKRRKIDIVYSNGLGVLVGFFTALFSGTKHVWHIHEIIGSPKYFYIAYRYLLNNGFKNNINIAVSEAVRSFWSREKSNNFRVIYNGIPILEAQNSVSKIRDKLGLPPSAIVIGMIGRVSYLKGQSYFVKICRELLKHDGSLKFIMVGDVYPGNEFHYDELRILKEDLNVADSIFDLGYRRDIPDVLAALDLFVLPSILPDSFPTVILEAMGQEKPIVATRQGGALEMLDENISGVFIPINDEKSACNIILPLLKDKKKRTEMGFQAKKKILKDFSTEKFRRELIATMESF